MVHRIFLQAIMKTQKIVVILLLIATAATAKVNKGTEPKYPNICFTKECIHTASRVLDFIDSTIDPCDNFYDFACGNFIKNTHIPEDSDVVYSLTKVEDNLLEQLKELVNEEPKENELKSFKLAHFYYKACTNKTRIEEQGIKPIVEITKPLGGWPVVEGKDWVENTWSWQETIKSFSKLGFSIDYLVDFSVQVDLRNSSKRIINVDQAITPFSREFLIKGFDDKFVQAYYNYMVEVAIIFGAEQKHAETDLKQSLEFEISLANISLPKEERRNSTALYNPMSIKEMRNKYPYVNWLDYINSLLPKELTVEDTEIINVAVPSYFKDLEGLLKNTPKRVIANYFMWGVYSNAINYLTDELQSKHLKFIASVTGQQEQEPRWKECIDKTRNTLHISVGAKYVRKYFNEEAKSIALEMVENIQKQFENILLKVSWMDEQTRKAALEKLKAMNSHIGYPDEIMNDKKLEEYYKDLEIEPESYLKTALKINIFETNYQLRQLREKVNKTDWRNHAIPAIVNAYYAPLENSITFPAGILQGVFFSPERPKYMNYGGIGFIIGHEITHGFDDQGSQYDSDGNLDDWWKESTKKSYLEKAKCIIEQYGNYTEKITKLKLNGINTQGENIADNGGLKESYLAYKKWVDKNGAELQLPGLNYSPQQMFWISAAQIWCAKYTSESLSYRILTGYHAPAEFRVNGPMSNLKEFSKDFNCSRKSFMNPVHKCEVW